MKKFPLLLLRLRVRQTFLMSLIISFATTSEDGGYIFRFFNPELMVRTFTLSVAGRKQKVKMKSAEIVSVRYNDGKFTVYNDSTPI